MCTGLQCLEEVTIVRQCVMGLMVKENDKDISGKGRRIMV